MVGTFEVVAGARALVVVLGRYLGFLTFLGFFVALLLARGFATTTISSGTLGPLTPRSSLALNTLSLEVERAARSEGQSRESDASGSEDHAARRARFGSAVVREERSGGRSEGERKCVEPVLDLKLAMDRPYLTWARARWACRVKGHGEGQFGVSSLPLTDRRGERSGAHT